MGVGELVGVCMCVHEGKINWERERIGHVFLFFNLSSQFLATTYISAAKNRIVTLGQKTPKGDFLSLTLFSKFKPLIFLTSDIF